MIHYGAVTNENKSVLAKSILHYRGGIEAAS